MPQAKIMSIEEKLAISNKACLLLKAGDREGYYRLTKSIPMPPYLAKMMKEKVGLDFLLDEGWNLSEAEAEYGTSFFTKQN